jgi:UDP-arabinose 4-epimerase
MKRVLVTGGAGYIGSHTCKALAKAGYEPVVFDDLSTGFESLVKWGELVRGDVCSKDSINRALERYRPVAVIHFAGRIAVGESVVSPWLHYERNVSGTISLLNAMAEQGVNKLVFSSSAAVYGVPTEIPVKENAPIAPLSPYGRSKAFAEAIIADYVHASNLKAVSLRYFNAAGADSDAETGECHDPETHLIPLAIKAAMDRVNAFSINGDDYHTADGTCLRDYIHVSDLADAHVCAVQRLEQGERLPLALNVGTGRGYSVRQIVDAISAVTGRDVPHTVGPRRAGDPASLVADCREVEASLGWAPKHSGLHDIIATAWRWHTCELSRPTPQPTAA